MNATDIIEDLRLVAPTDPWWSAKLLAGLVLGIALVAVVLWKLHRCGALPFGGAKPKPAHTTALERLASLRPLIQAGEVREFVTGVSGVVRWYIEQRFLIRAPNLSTEEFLHEAGQDALFTLVHRGHLADFLFCCDKVKFAIDHLDTGRMESLYEAARDFVVQTIPQPVEEVAP